MTALAILLTTIALITAGGIIWKIVRNRDQFDEDWDV